MDASNCHPFEHSLFPKKRKLCELSGSDWRPHPAAKRLHLDLPDGWADDCIPELSTEELYSDEGEGHQMFESHEEEPTNDYPSFHSLAPVEEGPPYNGQFERIEIESFKSLLPYSYYMRHMAPSEFVTQTTRQERQTPQRRSMSQDSSSRKLKASSKKYREKMKIVAQRLQQLTLGNDEGKHA